MKRAVLLACLLAVVGCKKHAAQESEAASGSSSSPASPSGSPKTPTAEPTAAPVAKAGVKLKELDPSEPQDLDALKRHLGPRFEWLSDETVADGWATSYAEPREENVQDDEGRVERKVTGKTYGVYVHRTIDGKAYKCVGKVGAREDVQAALDACKTIKP